MAGLTLGVAVLILVLSVLNGFDRELRTRILGTVPHALLEFENARTDLDPIAKQLRGNDRCRRRAIEPGRGLLVLMDEPCVAVLGVDPEQESKVSILPEHMTRGEFMTSMPRFSIILGSGAASLRLLR